LNRWEDKPQNPPAARRSEAYWAGRIPLQPQYRDVQFTYIMLRRSARYNFVLRHLSGEVDMCGSSSKRAHALCGQQPEHIVGCRRSMPDWPALLINEDDFATDMSLNERPALLATRGCFSPQPTPLTRQGTAPTGSRTDSAVVGAGHGHGRRATVERGTHFRLW
jgi:hypothetical protein